MPIESRHIRFELARADAPGTLIAWQTEALALGLDTAAGEIYNAMAGELRDRLRAGWRRYNGEPIDRFEVDIRLAEQSNNLVEIHGRIG